MSFNYLWKKKFEQKLLKGEFLKFIKLTKNNLGFKSTIRSRFKNYKHRFKYRTRFVSLQRFFDFYLLSCVRRIRGGIKVQNYRDIFFWVRFLDINPYIRSSIFFNNYSDTLKNNRQLMNRHSFFLSVLTKETLKLSRHPRIARRRVRYRKNIYRRNRYRKLKTILRGRAVLTFFVSSVFAQSFKYDNFSFPGNYVQFLSNLYKFF